MITLFNNYIVEPIVWLLGHIYTTVAFDDLGIAVILLTVLVRVVLFPVFYKSARDGAIMQKIQPKIKEIQKQHSENKEEQARALIALYKEHRLNPFSGFFLLLIQIPVFWALFKILSSGTLGATFDNTTFLGLINLGEKSFVIVAIAAIFQYIQGRLALPPGGNQEGTQAAVGKAMVWVGPLLTLIILGNLPAALGLYWAVSTLFSVFQQIYINKTVHAPAQP